MLKKYKIKSSYFFVYIILFSISSINISYSQEKKSIDIDSDNFTFNIKDSSMIFSGNVKINLENFQSFCDKSQVFINSKTKKLEKIKMTGNVKIRKDNSAIQAQSVIFDPINNKLIIEGNVKTKIQIEN